MKKGISIITAMFFAITGIIAQNFHRDQQTLFGDKFGFGGYLGTNVKMTEINNQEALFVGGELNFVLNHSFNIGVEGYGMTNSVFSNSYNESGERNYLEMGYGGLHLEPVLWSESIVHITFPVLLGAGGVAEHSEDKYLYHDYSEEVWTEKPYRSDFFLFAEPGVSAELNIFRMLRLAGGVSYRFVSDAQIPGLEKSMLEGYNVNLSLRLGWF